MTLITSGRKCLGLRGGRAHRGASPAGSCAPPPSVTQTCPCTPGGCLARPASGLRVFPFSGADLSMPCLLVRSQGWVSLAATEAVRGEKRVDTGGVRTEWGARHRAGGRWVVGWWQSAGVSSRFGPGDWWSRENPVPAELRR